MRGGSDAPLKSISAQLQKQREAEVGDGSNWDEPEGKANDLVVGGKHVLSSKSQSGDLDPDRASGSRRKAAQMRVCKLETGKRTGERQGEAWRAPGPEGRQRRARRLIQCFTSERWQPAG